MRAKTRIGTLSLMLLLAGGCSWTEVRTPTAEAAPTVESAQQEPDYLSHKVKDIAGAEVSLEKFRGDVVLIVNTASECGFTGQYKDLQMLHEKFAGKGLRVLGFPCNDFGGQEPGTEAEIASFCSAEFAVTFPLFSKVNVKSTPKHPLYKDLTEGSPEGIRGDVPWNFTKFLLDRTGKVVARFGPAVNPMDNEITGKIEEILKAPGK